MAQTKAAQAFQERGYLLLTSVFATTECDRMADLFDAHWVSRGRPPLHGFGMAIHPLLQHIPEMAPYYARPQILDALADILDGQPRLMHTGARVSDEQSDARLGWHEHYSWDRAGLLSRRHTERVLFGCYVRGLSDQTGPLVVIPRKLNDRIMPCPVTSNNQWPGEIPVLAPPGSVVIFDTALWHAARRGTAPDKRYLWGAHCQSIAENRPHPEDNSADNPLVEAFKRSDPRLRAFIDGR